MLGRQNEVFLTPSLYSAAVREKIKKRIHAIYKQWSVHFGLLQ